MKRTVLITIVALAGMGLTVAQGTAPDRLNYQGVLRDSDDNPLDGEYDMHFRFYSADVGGDWILVDRQDKKDFGVPVMVTNGLFNASLGAGDVIDGTGPGTYTSLAEVFRDYPEVYLEVHVGEVDVGPELLSPRVRILSAAYALNADYLDGWDSSSFVPGAMVEQNQVPRWNGTALEDGTIHDVSDRIGIGTTTPGYELDVAGTIRAYEDTFVGQTLYIFGEIDMTDGSGSVSYPDGTVQTTARHRPAPPCFDNVNRFVDCGNGSVTDTVSGLVWLKNANCFSIQRYADANDLALDLGDGQCGLSDGSAPGDWRLPTSDEWADLVRQAVTLGCPAPVIPDTTGYACWSEGQPFEGVATDNYWTSSTVEDDPQDAYRVLMGSGNIGPVTKNAHLLVWPVRDQR